MVGSWQVHTSFGWQAGSDIIAHYETPSNGQPLLQDSESAWPRHFQNCAEVSGSSCSSLLPSFSSFTGVKPSSWSEDSPHLLLLPPSLYFKSIPHNKQLCTLNSVLESASWRKALIRKRESNFFLLLLASEVLREIVWMSVDFSGICWESSSAGGPWALGISWENWIQASGLEAMEVIPKAPRVLQQPQQQTL